MTLPTWCYITMIAASALLIVAVTIATIRDLRRVNKAYRQLQREVARTFGADFFKNNQR